MMKKGEDFEYLAQIVVRNKREENAYCLVKAGNYNDLSDPWLKQCKQENILTAMPLFGKIRKNDSWPAYEDQICRLYRKFCSK